jgi:hypothetical protein
VAQGAGILVSYLQARAMRRIADLRPWQPSRDLPGQDVAAGRSRNPCGKSSPQTSAEDVT